MVRLRHLPVPPTAEVCIVRAVCAARQWIGTDETQKMILQLRLPARSYHRFDVYFHTSAEQFRARLIEIRNTWQRGTPFFLPLWHENHFTVIRGDGPHVHIFDPYHGIWGRYHPPPLDTIRSVFPEAALLPTGLQRDPNDTFCVMWGVWYMSGEYHRDATIDTLFRWLAGLMRHPTLRDDFRTYMVTDLDIAKNLVQTYVRIITNITASTYITALEQTPLHLDDPDVPLFEMKRSRHLRNKIVAKALTRSQKRMRTRRH